MFGRRKTRPLEHPSVAVIEHILSGAMAKSTAPAALVDVRTTVDNAVWFCACESFEEAPQWLIYETTDRSIGWRRLAPELEISDVVEAAHLTGNHVDPQAVLEWLRGQPHPGLAPPDASPDDLIVFDRVGQRVRELFFGDSRRASGM